MTLIPILTTTIRIPSLELVNKKVGLNRITRYGFFGTAIDVEIFEGDVLGTYLIKTPLPTPYDRIHLRKPKKTIDAKAKVLCIESARNFDIMNLDESTSLRWLRHPLMGDESTPEQIRDSWSRKFHFVEDDPKIELKGLRKPQLGALYAISARLTLDSNDPVTVVLPTGTGKTETMLSVLVAAQCSRVLVVVPSKALRVQIHDKFAGLGYLSRLGVIDGDTALPAVAFIGSGIKNVGDATELTQKANVLVATVDAISSCHEEVLKVLTEACSHLFIDEAHHVGAKTWAEIKRRFGQRKVIQFTATPFRQDGKSLGGTVIYNYPMGEAQRAGYFQSVRFAPIEEYIEEHSDQSIAEQAVTILRSDLEAGHDHLVLARVQSTLKADALLSVYQQFAPEYKPVVVHSKRGIGANRIAMELINNRQSRIIICVDMFGEGFDLSNLKIAAIHENHKSLAVVLQFVGRFTRQARHLNIGEAAVVLNIAEPKVQQQLQRLYSEDADWDLLLRRLSENAVDREIHLQNVIEGLKKEGNLHEQVSLWNLRPNHSTVLYKTKCDHWRPEDYTKAMPGCHWHGHAISRERNLLVLMAQRKADVKWGKYQDVYDLTFQLLIAHWDEERSVLFIYASDYDYFRSDKLAQALCGEDVALVTGNPIFRVFNDVEYPLVRNLGAAREGTISFTQYFGPNVTDGLAEVEKSSSNLSNIAGWGYQDGEKVNWGCSQKKGKVWSVKSGAISDWIEWCYFIWDKVSDDSLLCNNITNGFLKPVKLEDRHPVVAVSVEWGEYILRCHEHTINVRFDDQEFYVFDVSLCIEEFTETGGLIFCISTSELKSVYRLDILPDQQQSRGYIYEHVSGPAISIRKGSGTYKELPEYMVSDPLIFRYADGSFSYNCFLVKVPEETGTFRPDRIETWDWYSLGVDIKKESMGKNCIIDSIQYATWQGLEDRYDLMINDDDAGEAADLVGLKYEADTNEIVLGLIHCKYSAGDNPGGRIKDLYEVCGQAQKSIRWKHSPLHALVDHLRNREERWRESNHSRILKGSISDLVKYKVRQRTARVRLEVYIVQPGLSKSDVTDQMLRLLGTTELYLQRTTNAPLFVIGSD
ncbi:DEAD/DEAH box helicase [Thalassolituus oleivorans]|uniref:DEAD/DEAH box helicase n=1 Tax=Thalassolituus oleivorans TaxID=187493 RepID=UPI0030C815E9